jgi:hypothetical protein
LILTATAYTANCKPGVLNVVHSSSS